MAFGIGINTEHTEQEPLSGTYHEVAVQCWFTATGKSLPLMLKVKGEDEDYPDQSYPGSDCRKTVVCGDCELEV